MSKAVVLQTLWPSADRSYGTPPTAWMCARSIMPAGIINDGGKFAAGRGLGNFQQL
jgi:hypothetical protein